MIVVHRASLVEYIVLYFFFFWEKGWVGLYSPSHFSASILYVQHEAHIEILSLFLFCVRESDIEKRGEEREGNTYT